MLLFFVPLWLASIVSSHSLACSHSFYRAGALVFGGGHVVLPLLNEAVVAPGWVSQQAFLAGYGAAQAVPGPLFTFSAYLGAIEHPSPNGVAGAAIALVAIFLPSFLLLGAALPLWSAARERDRDPGGGRRDRRGGRRPAGRGAVGSRPQHLGARRGGRRLRRGAVPAPPIPAALGRRRIAALAGAVLF